MFALVFKDAPSCKRLARFRSSLFAPFAEHHCDSERCLPVMWTVSFNTGSVEVDKPFTAISIGPRRALCRLRSRVRSDWGLLRNSKDHETMFGIVRGNLAEDIRRGTRGGTR